MIDILLSFAILGGGIKYVDDALDEGIYDIRIAKILSFLLLILWIFTCLRSPYAATILTAIFLSVLISGKLNTKLGIIIGFAIICSLWLYISSVLMIPLIFLTLLGIIDELGNDYADRHQLNLFLDVFFKHRCMMKIGVFILTIIGIIPVLYLLAFLLFDLTYDIIGYLGQCKKNLYS